MGLQQTKEHVLRHFYPGASKQELLGIANFVGQLSAEKDIESLRFVQSHANNLIDLDTGDEWFRGFLNTILFLVGGTLDVT